MRSYELESATKTARERCVAYRAALGGTILLEFICFFFSNPLLQAIFSFIFSEAPDDSRLKPLWVVFS
jgi:hypothetical protein